jgi:hypothetical protein
MTMGNSPGPQKSITGANMMVSIPEDFFARGLAYSYQDYMNYEAAQVRNFIFDPTNYIPPEGAEGRVVGFFPSFFAEAGPITAEFFAGTEEEGDGTPLVLFNRDGSSVNIPLSTLKVDPSEITNDGTRFTGIGIPANATGSGQQVSSEVQDELPFALDITQKYLIRVTNTNGAGTLVMMRFTFFEI